MTPAQRQFCDTHQWFRALNRDVVDAGLGIGPYVGRPIQFICERHGVQPSLYYRCRGEWGRLVLESPVGESRQNAMIRLHHLVVKLVDGREAAAFNKDGDPVDVTGEEAEWYTWPGAVAFVAAGMNVSDSKLFLATIAEAVRLARAIKPVRAGRVTKAVARKIIAAAVRGR